MSMYIEVTADKIISKAEVRRLTTELDRERAAALAGFGKLSFITDYYLIRTTLNTGLRISEQAELKWKDVTDRYLIVRIGKGGKKKPHAMPGRIKELEALLLTMTTYDKKLTAPVRKELARLKLLVRAVNKRTVYFGPETHRLFTEFKAWQISQGLPCGPEDNVFIGARGPLKRFGLHERFDYWRKRLQFPPSISFHSLRHYYATWLLEQGVSLAMISRQLGHSSVIYTAGYLHHTVEAREQIIALL